MYDSYPLSAITSAVGTDEEGISGEALKISINSFVKFLLSMPMILFITLSQKLQLAGYDMDKNVITRIETNKRYVTDFELKAFTEIFNVSYEYLIDGTDSKRTE